MIFHLTLLESTAVVVVVNVVVVFLKFLIISYLLVVNKCSSEAFEGYS